MKTQADAYKIQIKSYSSKYNTILHETVPLNIGSIKFFFQ